MLFERWQSFCREHQEQETRDQNGPHRHRHFRALLASHPHNSRSSIIRTLLKHSTHHYSTGELKNSPPKPTSHSV